MLMSLGEAARAMNGLLDGPDAAFTSVSTDSRKDVASSLFFALVGERHDGHSHVQAAFAGGARGAVVSREVLASGFPLIRVDDTQRALGDLAGAWRSRMNPVVIAITGNSGKTTTKEFAAAILGSAAATLATAGNLNNEIGVPLTLFRLESGHRYAVIEMGQGRPGDIAYLAKIARPDIALVTNVTGAHLAGFGNLERIAAGKGEVYAGLGPEGTAIINLDDAFAGFWLSGLPQDRRRMTFGLRDDADVRAGDVRLGNDACARFTLIHGDDRTDVELAIPGVHNVSNALAAASVGILCGISLATIASALSTVGTVPGRLVVHNLPGGVRVVDDTYNANPGSVKAAIRTLCNWHDGPRVLVLGDMAELGPDAASLHREIGLFAREAGVDRLLVTGIHARAVEEGFGVGAAVYADADELARALCAELVAGVTVLVKGSRSARMERVVAAITGEQDAAVAH